MDSKRVLRILFLNHGQKNREGPLVIQPDAITHKRTINICPIWYIKRSTLAFSTHPIIQSTHSQARNFGQKSSTSTTEIMESPSDNVVWSRVEIDDLLRSLPALFFNISAKGDAAYRKLDWCFLWCSSMILKQSCNGLMRASRREGENIISFLNLILGNGWTILAESLK